MNSTSGGHAGNRADSRAASGLAPATTSSESLVDVAELFGTVGSEGEAPRPPYRWDAVLAVAQPAEAALGLLSPAELRSALVCLHLARLGPSMREPG
jgi:hypothetical protein